MVRFSTVEKNGTDAAVGTMKDFIRVLIPVLYECYGGNPEKLI